MSRFKLNEKGFIFIETLFVALIVSFTAIIILNGLDLAIKSNRLSVIRMNAIHLANARMAEIEEYVDSNKKFPPSSYTLLNDSDLIYANFFGINGTVRFQILPPSVIESTNKNTVTIEVTWTVNNNDYGKLDNEHDKEKITKDIYIIPETSSN